MGIFSIIVGLGAYLVWLSGQQYVPSEIAPAANQFLNFLQKGDYYSAYEMTQKNSFIGTDIEKFKISLNKQLGQKPDNIDSTAINYISTRQTYGNRWRRWTRRQDLDVDQISIDFIVSSKSGVSALPFEIRFTRNSEKIWKISYFQSHAG